MQRGAGKFAIFLVGIYALVLFGLVVSAVTGNPIPLAGWPAALVPGAAFGYAFIDAVKLHRTTDPATATKLWRRSLLLAVIGTVLLVGATIIINRITTV
jgi:phosphoglycerol transferase MdoB-like AlkP superfamily enzyme